jgi:NUMOD4 motif
LAKSSKNASTVVTVRGHEKWRAVVGYEDWYEVSSLGRVRRIVDRYDRVIPVACRRVREAGVRGLMSRDTAGEKHPNSKLTESDVVQIRKAFSSGAKRRALANKYGVTWEAIHSIVNRTSWSHVK